MTFSMDEKRFSNIKVLLVDDDKNSYLMIREFFKKFKDKNCQLQWTASYSDAVKSMRINAHDVYLVDYRLGDRNGLELLREAKGEGCSSPIIILTAEGDEKTDVEAMREGAADFLIKGETDVRLLERSIRYSFEHSRTFQAFRESEAKYRNLVETLPVMFYAVEPNPPFAPIYLSPSFEKFGYKLKDWYNNQDMWVKSLHPEDREMVLRETESAMNQDGETNYEYRLKTNDGTFRWIHDRGRFFKDQNGKIICWQGILIDVTERKVAEKSLSDNEERYGNLFENANDIVYVHDLQGNYISVNQAAERIFGYKREEILKMNMSQIVAPEDLKFVRQKLAEKHGDVRHSTYEVRCLNRNGQQIILEVNSCGIYEDAVLTAIQGIARDITERKRTEEALRESEAKFRTVAETASDAILTIDETGTIIFVNAAAEKIFGYQAKQMIGQNLSLIMPERLRKKHDGGISRYMRTQKRKISWKAVEFPGLHKDGYEILLELSFAEYSRQDKRFFTSVIRDITERKNAEEALKESEARFRDLFENANDLIYTHDLHGNFTSLNRAGEIITGYKREEALEMNISEVVAPEYLKTARQMTLRKMDGEPPTSYELEIISKNGNRVTLELSTQLIYKDEKPIGVQGIGRDITGRKVTEEQLQRNALYDALTDLPNRAHFMKQLNLAVERAEIEKRFLFAVLFLDLDRFKIINDSLGHVIGDKLLVEIAERLKSCVRPSDVIARLGGDEFTILLTIKDKSDAVQIAERVQEKLSKPFKLDNYEVFTSASVGIIISDEVRRQPEEYLRDADAAMYRAKETGKARYEIFDRKMYVQNVNLLRVETDLRHAIERNEFRVHYQPIVALETGEIREFESLIRWQHPTRGMIPPNDFISIAEETGLIIPIGKWILEESCRQMHQWQEEYQMAKPLSISVNLSAKQLMHPSLTAQVREILEKTKLDPRYLKLEVTESTVMEHSETALNVLSELRELGVRLSTDDFGTGFSSLSYLHRFPFERLKIDRSFINKMDSDSKSSEIVRTIVMLAQNLNIETVAEGVENWEQLRQLQKLGCDFGQGYLFSKPVIAETAEKLLKDGLQIALPDSEISFITNGMAVDGLIEVENLQ